MNDRTPKHYSGTQNPVKKMADLLPDLMADLGKRAADPREEIFRFWNELIGEKIAPMAEAISFFEGILTVKVKSSTLYTLLVTHERPRLLRRLQEKFSIRNIVFRVG